MNIRKHSKTIFCAYEPEVYYFDANLGIIGLEVMAVDLQSIEI